MTDETKAEGPRQLEASAARANRRFIYVAAAFLLALVISGGVVLVSLILSVRDVERQESRNATQHRERNELIHDCVVRKQDAFRRDVYRLMQTQPGQAPNFPEADGIVCPPITP